MTDKQWMKWMEAGACLGCHQMPERSFFYKDYQFPVCARCTGVLLASVLAFCLFFVKKIPWKVCAAMAGVMLADWLVQYAGIKESTNKRRFVTGLIGGFGWTTLQLHLYKYLWDRLREVIFNKTKTFP